MAPDLPLVARMATLSRAAGRRFPSKVGKPRRTSRLEVRLTPAEHQALRNCAKEAKLRPSAYVRASILGQVPRIVPAANPDIARALSRVGNNVNQIARSLNLRSGEDPTRDELVEAYRELRGLIRQTYLELLS
jgi:hypothetical protein